ncbi:unnamed protein product [Urochloa humidicola]
MDDGALRLQLRASIARYFFLGSASAPVLVDADLILEILVRRLPPLSVVWQRFCRLVSDDPAAGFLRDIPTRCWAILSRFSFACYVRHLSSSSSHAAVGARATLGANAERVE